LSWKPEYLSRLKKYAAELNLPLLIAWKWETAGIWVLFEIKHLQFARTNYNISFGKAATENLLSRLAGDFAVSFAPNVGFHLLHLKIGVQSNIVLDE